ncbi:MAG: beta-galactosidase [Candidatus Marinimicrobia bacterium]|nr:beta-galactosidase [Candidatus Neomarinimicrobiota bacterium]MCF7850926.1 beta-galactosidase [Candidatus Neomarinimicrobiota bacterium]
MSELGFNTVKFWVQWRWNQPTEDQYDFSDIDELMDLAAENDLKVMLNTIIDVAPAWIYAKYPDASMVTRDGVRIGPQTQPHRQIGGLGYCFNHQGVRKHMENFLHETIMRYTNHPALEIWNVGSEPELTSSMAEMREYANDHQKMGQMLCYCSNCQTAFKAWITDKYVEINRLNIKWNRNYSSFEEVEIPRTRNTFNDMIDWRMFFVHTLGENVKQRFKIAKTEDQGRHPLMCHHVFIQGFPLTSTANDPWNVAQYGDLHGFTQMDDMMMIDVLRSSAGDKPVISAEMLMLPGYTLDLPDPVSEDDIKRFIFSGVAGNLKGFIFWQYRPELLGREAPTWGLSGLAGESTPTLDQFASCGSVLQDNAELILGAKPQKAGAALLYHPENQIFGWASTGAENTVTDSLLGAHRALYESNHQIDIIHPNHLSMEQLESYQILILPFPYVLGDKLAQLIKEWVKAGGTLLAEAYFGGWDIEKGKHASEVPAYGFAEVFGVKHNFAVPVKNAVKINLGGEPAIQSLYGSLVRENIELIGAEVIGTFEDDTPAITRSQYGQGVAIYCATYLFLGAHREAEWSNKIIVQTFLPAARNYRPITIDSIGDIRVDLLETDESGCMLIVQNLRSKAVTGTISLSKSPAGVWVEGFTGEKLPILESEQGSTTIKVDLTSQQVKVYTAK